MAESADASAYGAFPGLALWVTPGGDASGPKLCASGGQHDTHDHLQRYGFLVVNADEFFLDTIDDLQRRIDGHLAEYDMLHIAALLRRLLLDDTPQADRVNRSRRLKIKFRVNDRIVPASDEPITWSALDGFDPETGHPEGEVLELTREAFLARVILHHAGTDFTVREVINALANVADGVHFGEPSEDRERILAEVSEFFKVGDLSGVLGSLLAVSRVVLKGLQPLRETIEADLGFPSHQAIH